jgi:hypothetical protein
VVEVAEATVKRFVERASQLYEQERGKPAGLSRLGGYVRRWQAWAAGGLQQNNEVFDSRGQHNTNRWAAWAKIQYE